MDMAIITSYKQHTKSATKKHSNNGIDNKQQQEQQQQQQQQQFAHAHGVGLAVRSKVALLARFFNGSRFVHSNAPLTSCLESLQLAHRRWGRCMDAGNLS
eukprot:4412581-Amphidinium_carterae.1